MKTGGSSHCPHAGAGTNVNDFLARDIPSVRCCTVRNGDLTVSRSPRGARCSLSPMTSVKRW